MERQFRLAMVQMQIAWGDRTTNQLHATALIREAARNGARMIVLPETCDIGWTNPRAGELAQTIPQGASFQMLRQCAIENGVYLCAGLTERDGDKVYNSAVLINPLGKLLLRHRKINELDIAHDIYAQGQALLVANTELGAIGVMICADGFAKGEVISRSLGYMGTDIIISPCAWAMPENHVPEDGPRQSCVNQWREVYAPVARVFSIYIVGVSGVGRLEAGPWQGRQAIGCSLAFDPNGNELVQCPFGVDAEWISYIDVDLVKRPARGCGIPQGGLLTRTPEHLSTAVPGRIGTLVDLNT